MSPTERSVRVWVEVVLAAGGATSIGSLPAMLALAAMTFPVGPMTWSREPSCPVLVRVEGKGPALARATTSLARASAVSRRLPIVRV